MNPFKQAMPLRTSQHGVWEGWYRCFDPAGNKLDERRRTSNDGRTRLRTLIDEHKVADSWEGL